MLNIIETTQQSLIRQSTIEPFCTQYDSLKEFKLNWPEHVDDNNKNVDKNDEDEYFIN